NTETWEEVLVSDRDTVERIGGFLQDGMEVMEGMREAKRQLQVHVTEKGTCCYRDGNGAMPLQLPQASELLGISNKTSAKHVVTLFAAAATALPKIAVAARGCAIAQAPYNLAYAAIVARVPDASP
ncbi:unnamed protein product, partial [Rangifer tarandus platyrhynchus]